MANVPRVPLGGHMLARRWFLDINTGTYAAPTWTPVNGVEDFKAPLDPTVQDDSDYDSGGYKSSSITALGWKIELKLARKATAALATAYDPGQEALRAASLLMGASNRVDVRFYEVTASGPITEAYRGYATVSWSEDGGGMDALASITCSLTGQGARTAITHPDFALAAPTIYAIHPTTAAVAGGTLLHIRGVNFFKAGVDDIVLTTGITLNAVNFTKWLTEDDQNVFGVTPATTAGSRAVIVTNSTGASAGFNITVA